MWVSHRLSAVGNLTLRKIALLFVAGFLSALFVAVAHTHPTFADDASWSGDSISYGGTTYTKLSPPPTLPGVPENDDVYSTPPTAGKDVSVIAIPQNSDTTKNITDAKLFTYSYDGQVYSNARPPNGEAVTVDAKAGGDDAANSNQNQNQTSCAVTGVGWIICSVSRWIADGMDHTFNLISGFLTVKPLVTDTSSGLYQAWNIARGLANACFIIAFLIIIYSQITSYGISNYEIKKMIPKLIVAAILVNVSYYICALAVDVSNILGDSIQKALIEVRQSLPSPMPGGSMFNWSSMTEFLLSGGTVAVAGIAGYAAFTGAAVGGSVTALVFMLFPILVSGLLRDRKSVV